MEGENHSYGNRDDELRHLGCEIAFEVYFFDFKYGVVYNRKRKRKENLERKM